MIKKGIFILVSIFIVHKIVLWIQPFGSLLSKIPFSQEVVDRNGNLLRLSLSEDQIYRLKTDLTEISPLLRETTLLYEDRYFYWHMGVNPFSMVRAAWSTFVSKNRMMGASTITMQLSRLLFKMDSRGLIGKVHQMMRALQIEFLYSKDDILEAYLNIAPYGFNIEGVGAASRIYFDKHPRRLSLLESLTLSVIPQNPTKRTRHIQMPPLSVSKEAYNKPLKKALHRLFSQWVLRHPNHFIKKIDSNLNLDMRHPRRLPFYAPHLVTEVMGKRAEDLITEKRSIVLSLDLPLQLMFEKVAKSYIHERKRHGVKNMSALLVDTQSMEVLSYIGSVDFFNEGIHGQVNGVRARRSPGSALKPFVYGLAMEQGIIHPLSTLKDARTSFGLYTPDNFDSRFSGPLSATQALVLSRNIPAIRLTRQLSVPKVHKLFHSLNIPLHPNPQHYGLSIILGTTGVTMEELVKSYALLNNKGRYRPIKKQMDPVPMPIGVGVPIGDHLFRFTGEMKQMKRRKSKEQEKQIFSKEVAFLVLDMLTQNPHPQGKPGGSTWKLHPQSVAWKTGTSMGFRDAWAVGVFDHYVLATWVGHFSGHGNQAFVGRKVAGPLLFSLIEALAKVREVNFSKPSPTSDLNLTSVDFCPLSGRLPHKDCPHRKKGWFIPGVSPIHRCKVHRRIEIDLVSGYQVCSGFKGPTQTKVFENWPTDILKLFQQAGLGRKTPPPRHPKCRQDIFGDMDPKILSPKERIVYNLRTSGSDSKKIPFLAIGDGSVKNFSWYVNNQFVGQSQMNHPLLWMAASGQHTVRVIDDHGRSTEVALNVQWVD